VLVVNHPYYAATDEHGEFRLTNATGRIRNRGVAHEGWRVAREEAVLDV